MIAMEWEKSVIQIQLPDPKDHDPHPRLLVDGRGIHAGGKLGVNRPPLLVHLDARI